MVPTPIIIFCLVVIILCLIALHFLSRGGSKREHTPADHHQPEKTSIQNKQVASKVQIKGSKKERKAQKAKLRQASGQSMQKGQNTPSKRVSVKHVEKNKSERSTQKPAMLDKPVEVNPQAKPETPQPKKPIEAQHKPVIIPIPPEPAKAEKPEIKNKRQAPDTIVHSNGQFDLLSCSVQGEGHVASEKECQDYSSCWVDGKTMVCIVCDGHGGDRYFRSRIGAERAAIIAFDAIKRFLWEDKTTETLQGKEFRSFGIYNERTVISAEDKQITAIFDQLFRSIVSQWHESVRDDARHNPINGWENKNVKPEYLKQLEELKDVEKIYGCTLMAYVQTDKLWFSFQIGDGKFVALDVNGVHSSEPIPWDDQCFINKTTSLCGSNASEEFRFCCQGDGKFPCAVFLGSDGIDDTFHTEKALSDFYIKLAKYSLKNGLDNTAKEMEDSLPILSKRGSQDDMSVSFLIDRNRFTSFIPTLIQDQLHAIQGDITSTETELKDLQDKVTAISSKAKLTEREQINLQYHMKDIEEKKSSLSKLKEKYEKTKLELETTIR